MNRVSINRVSINRVFIKRRVRISGFAAPPISAGGKKSFGGGRGVAAALARLIPRRGWESRCAVIRREVGRCSRKAGLASSPLSLPLLQIRCQTSARVTLFHRSPAEKAELQREKRSSLRPQFAQCIGLMQKFSAFSFCSVKKWCDDPIRRSLNKRYA